MSSKFLRERRNDHCIKATVYTPNPFRNQTHSSVGFSGAIPRELAEFLQQALLKGLTGNMIAEVEGLTRRIKAGE